MEHQKTDAGQTILLLQIECLAVFFLLPVIIYLFRHFMAFRVVPILILTGPAAYFYLKNSQGFDAGIFTRIKGMSLHFKTMILSFAVIVPVVMVYTWKWMPEHFLKFPKERPWIWLMVMLLYPVLAALPQEIIFRCFFFHRYRKLFHSPTVMIIVNGVSFGMFHMFYGNWIAPVLSGLGGCLFGYRYHRSDSLPVVALEHALWGNLLFSNGLGWYFYSGSIH